MNIENKNEFNLGLANRDKEMEKKAVFPGFTPLMFAFMEGSNIKDIFQEFKKPTGFKRNKKFVRRSKDITGFSNLI